jgi:hypothetical protein
MAVRVRLRVEAGGRVREVVALVNSGYEADTPQLMVPIGLARELGLWPPPPDAREELFDTAGGPVRVWVVRGAAAVRAVAGDAESGPVETDIVVSHFVDEPLISDVLAGKLGIAVEDFLEGLWRFRWEPREKVRRSEKPAR